MAQISIERKITVDLKKFKGFHPLVKVDAYDESLDDYFFGKKTFQLSISSNILEKYFFKYIKEGLGEYTQTDFLPYFDEILYLFILIKRSNAQIELKGYPNDFKKKSLGEYIELLEGLEFIKEQKNDVKFKLSIIGGSKDKSMIIPETLFNEELYQEILAIIHQHHTTRNMPSGLWHSLMFFKNQPTIETLKKTYDSLPSIKTGRRPFTKFSKEANLLLKYIRDFPQYQDSKKNNSVLTEAQGSFIHHFIVFFGIEDGSYTVDFREVKDTITFNKNLRYSLRKKNNYS